MRYILESPVSGHNESSKHYQCTISWRAGTFITDEPPKTGGGDTGPDPYTLLLSSLITCTLDTLRMYIDRKGWDVPGIRVQANLFQTIKGEETITTIDRDIRFEGPAISAEQEGKLLEIAQKCPVSKILSGTVSVRTYIYHDEAAAAKRKEYPTESGTVVWRQELCRHSGRCVMMLPEVFRLKAHPWVDVQGADPATIKAQVERCPTGALTWADSGSRAVAAAGGDMPEA